MAESFALSSKIFRGGGGLANEITTYQFVISNTQFSVSGIFVNNTNIATTASLVQIYAR